jgi:transmembrane sensor
MDELILRYLNGEATDVETHRLEKWRAAAPDNETRFQEAHALWSALGQVLPHPRQPHPPVDALVREAERRRQAARARASRRAFLSSPRAGYGVAAAAVAVLVFVGLRAWSARTVPGASLAAVESTLGPGQVVAITLSDGSYVRLAPGASLGLPVASGRREVTLEGRAFFAVAGAQEPFTVRTGRGEVTVVGTRFEVRSEGAALRAVVVEGAVEVRGRAGRARAIAGQVAEVEGDSPPRVTTVEDVGALLDWPGGLLAFQGTPLAAVARELERHFGVSVRIQDPAAGDLGITGSFQEESLAEVVEAVCAVTGIRCQTSPAGVVMGGG